MPAIIRQLHNEMVRLRAELADLVRRRSELLAPLDMHIADVEQRLQAAERMLATYIGQDTEPGTHDTGRLSRWNGNRQRPESINLTWINVETVDIPSSLRGHPIRPDSKKAKIIKATKALLQETGTASRLEIVKFLITLNILGKEKNPSAYLSVILSYSKEIFATDGVVWYLRDTEQAVSTDSRDA
jgi:CRP-like cAMP-binding protein